MYLAATNLRMIFCGDRVTYVPTCLHHVHFSDLVQSSASLLHICMCQKQHKLPSSFISYCLTSALQSGPAIGVVLTSEGNTKDQEPLFRVRELYLSYVWDILLSY